MALEATVRKERWEMSRHHISNGTGFGFLPEEDVALSYLGHTLTPRGSWDPSAATGGC